MHCKTCNKTKFKSQQALMEHQKHCRPQNKKHTVRGYRSGRARQSVVNTGVMRTGRTLRNIDNRPYVISGYDYIGKVTAKKAPAATADHILFEQSIAPHAFTGTRLKQVSNLFEYVEFLIAEIVYVPNAPKTIGGQLLGYFDLDPKDDPGTIANHDALVRSCMAHTGAQQFNLNNSVTIKMPKRGDRQKYFTGPTKSNSRFDMPGIFRVVQVTNPMAMDGSAITADDIDGGLCYLRWTCKFTVPQLEPESANVSRASPSQTQMFNESSIEITGSASPHIQHFTLKEPSLLYVNHVSKDVESTTTFSVALSNHDGSPISSGGNPFEHIFSKSTMYSSVPKVLEAGDYQVVVQQTGGPANTCGFWLYAKSNVAGVFDTPWSSQPVEHVPDPAASSKASTSSDEVDGDSASDTDSVQAVADSTDIANLRSIEECFETGHFDMDLPPAVRDGSVGPTTHADDQGNLLVSIPIQADTYGTRVHMLQTLKDIAKQEREEHRKAGGECEIDIPTSLNVDVPILATGSAEENQSQPPTKKMDIVLDVSCADLSLVRKVLSKSPYLKPMESDGDQVLSFKGQATGAEIIAQIEELSKIDGISISQTLVKN